MQEAEAEDNGAPPPFEEDSEDDEGPAVGRNEEAFSNEQLIATAAEIVRARVAMGSAPTDIVINPDELLEDAALVPNTAGDHFVGPTTKTLRSMAKSILCFRLARARQVAPGKPQT